MLLSLSLPLSILLVRRVWVPVGQCRLLQRHVLRVRCCASLEIGIREDSTFVIHQVLALVSLSLFIFASLGPHLAVCLTPVPDTATIIFPPVLLWAEPPVSHFFASMKPFSSLIPLSSPALTAPVATPPPPVGAAASQAHATVRARPPNNLHHGQEMQHVVKDRQVVRLLSLLCRIPYTCSHLRAMD